MDWGVWMASLEMIDTSNTIQNWQALSLHLWYTIFMIDQHKTYVHVKSISSCKKLLHCISEVSCLQASSFSSKTFQKFMVGGRMISSVLELECDKSIIHHDFLQHGFCWNIDVENIDLKNEISKIRPRKKQESWKNR